MNDRGQMNSVSMILVVAITLIVGIVLFQVIAQEVGGSTSTQAIANQSLGNLDNDTVLYVTNCRALSDVAIFNATGDEEVASSNYTVTNNVIHPTTGALTVSVTPTVTAGYLSAWDVGTATIDGTCQPLDYIASSGGRAMASLIVIFFALAIAVVAISPTLRSGLVNMVKR